jgi:hypothetical protein
MTFAPMQIEEKASGLAEREMPSMAATMNTHISSRNIYNNLWISQTGIAGAR